MKNKPNLFVVGFPKSGTTSFHDYLSQHPDIFMSKEKEPHYFCSDLISESKKFSKKREFTSYNTLKKYETLFQQLNSERIIGESSVWYLYSKKAAQNIHDYNPNAKIIIFIREPISFLESLHSQLIFASTENEKNFLKALNLESCRKKGNNIPNICRSPSLLYYSEILKFSKQIQRYLELFHPENIKIVLFDNLKKDSLNEYREILEFLNVKNTNFKPNVEIINPNKKARFQTINIFLKRQDIFVKKILQNILPHKIKKTIYSKIIKFNTKYTKRDKINEIQRQKLMKKYKPEVIKLNKLLKNNNLISEDLIKLWGYDNIK